MDDADFVEVVAADKARKEKVSPIGIRKFKDKFGFHRVLIYDGLDILTDIIRHRIKEQERKQDSVFLVSGLEGCQPKGSKVLMANGEFKNIEDIREGEYVLSPQHDGTNKVSKVINTTKWYSEKNYEVRTLNRKQRLLYKCSSNHLIPLNYIKTKGHTNRVREWNIKDISADEYYKYKRSTKQNATTLLSFPIQYFYGINKSVDLDIEPYSLGVYIGDGNFSYKSKRKYLSITSNDSIVLDEVKKFYPIMSIGNKKGTDCKTYRFSNQSEFYNKLLLLGLANKKSGDKFIPKDALLSSINFRKRLLAGLIDTDSYFNNGHYTYTTKSEQLKNDICFLLGSLGIRFTTTNKIKGIKKTGFVGEYFDINFYLQKDMNIPVLTERRIKKINDFYLSSNRLSIDLKLSSPEMVYGFTLDSASGWYITDNWMITHNSGKSLFTLWCADIYGDESGQVIGICNVTRTLKELFRTIYNLRDKPSLLTLDEGSELDGTNHNTKEVKLTKKKFTVMRKCSHIILLCFVNPLKITTYFREDRVRGLFFVVSKGEVWYYSNNQNNPHLANILDSWSREHEAKSLKFLKTYAPDMILRGIPEYRGRLRTEYESRKDDNIFDILKDKDDDVDSPPEVLDESSFNWVNLKAAASIVGVTETTLRNLIHKGKLEYKLVRNKIHINKEQLINHFSKGKN